jgi:stage II sporulation protein D
MEERTKTLLTTKDTKRTKERTRSMCFHFVFFVTFVVTFLRGLDVSLPAQVDVTEADLTAASAGRTIRVGSVADGHVTIVPLEVYVARVLAGEADPKAGDAAQQALAIAVRTYTLKNSNRHARDGYDLCDSTHCQVPRPSTPASRRAAMATVGQVLTWHGEVAEVFYSASCGGRSERAADVWPGADYPYLVSRPDDVCQDDPEWTTEFALGDVQRALERVGFEGDRLKDVRVDARTSSGRVARLRLSGMRPDVIAGDQFRLAIGAVNLRSTAFTLETHGDALRFIGRGFGHGVGMCVIGAARRALRGESARMILAQYYPGLELTPLSGIAPIETSTSVLLGTRPSPPAAPSTAAPPAFLPRVSGITVTVPPSSRVTASEIERMAASAHAELARSLGISVLPFTIRLHETLDSFRLATNRPWWVSEVADGTVIDLAPAGVLAQRGGVEASIRIAVAELLVARPLAGRPAWVRVGAARYFGEGTAAVSAASPGTRCPPDAELLLAVSAPAQREAEQRAEACFARELARAGDWKLVQ